MMKKILLVVSAVCALYSQVSAQCESGCSTSNAFFGRGAGKNNTSSFNSFFGANAGKDNKGFQNSFFGRSAGSNTTGNINSFFGQLSGFSHTIGDENCFFGDGTGQNHVQGSQNSFFGRNAGKNNTNGNRNVFLGYKAGFNEQGSDKLYIANSDTESPLIFGDFAQNIVRINGKLEVSEGIDGIVLDNDDSNIFIGQGAGLSNTTGGQNTFVGDEAGRSNTTGSVNAFFGRLSGASNTYGAANSFFGTFAGFDNTTGSRNSFFGRGAGTNNTVGDGNAFFGHNVGFNNKTGTNNSFLGAAAGTRNDSGSDNTYVGSFAGFENVAGSGNVFLGNQAGFNETGSNKLYISNNNTKSPLIYGDFTDKIVRINGKLEVSEGIDGIVLDNDDSNIFIGQDAGLSNTTGGQNTFVGNEAGRSNTTGSVNAFFGRLSGASNTSGAANSFFGTFTGFDNTTGSRNSFFGRGAGSNNTVGDGNAFFGHNVGFNNISGKNNAFFGAAAGTKNDGGSDNTYVGSFAGFENVAGSGNVFLGNQAGFNETGSNKLYIANSNTESPLIYGEFDKKVVNINGQVGIGIDTPEHSLHLRSSEAVFRIDGDTQDPGLALVRYNNGFGKVLKSFYFFNHATGVNKGKFVIADRGTKVNGASKARLIIDNQGNVGIGNRFQNLKNNATARLHVDGTVRFQNLPTGEGQPLVIDRHGKILRASSSTNTRTSNLDQENSALRTRVEKLEEELEQLKLILGQIKVGNQVKSSAQLYQNEPNPFDQTTTINMFIPNDIQQATLYIHTLQGKTIKQIPIFQRGETSVEITKNMLGSGMYLYALMVDNKKVDAKRMLIK